LPSSVRAELVEALPFFCDGEKKVQPFDKLRVNGEWGGPDASHGEESRT
jgi:hypothetical protein